MKTVQPVTKHEANYPSRSTRLFLGLAFAALLAILLGTGWSALRTLSEMHAREENARRNFLSRTEPIVVVRSKLTVYGNLAQDLAAPDGVSFTTRANDIFQQIQTELELYPRLRKPDEQQLIGNLQKLIADEDRSKAIAAAEEIVSWNTGQLRLANAELLTDFNFLRGRMKQLLVILLGCALAIAIGSLAMITIQQREIHTRYAELSRNHEVQAQLSSRLMEAQEGERLTISRELHDEVGQSLGALLVDLGSLASAVPSGDERVQEAIRKIRSSAESSVNSVRNIALLLRPSMLDDLGLVAAIEWQAREVSRRSEVEVEVDAPEIPGDLRDDVKICLYRLVQEALNNVAKHSGARHAWVTLRQDQRQIALTIRDDGKGFDPERSRGLGILGMKERLRLLHGLLTIESAPGTGTSIAASVPLA